MADQFFTASRVTAAIEWASAEADKIASLPDFEEEFDGVYLKSRRRAVELLSAIQAGETLGRDDEKMAAEYILMAERGESYC